MVRTLFLDANVMMYALGKDHPYREPCRRILDLVRKEELRLVTSVEVLHELLHRYRSLGLPAYASTVYRSTCDLCAEIFAIEARAMERAHDLLEKDAGLSVRDALHVATAGIHGISEILTTDRHFDGFPEVTRVDPIGLSRP